MLKKKLSPLLALNNKQYILVSTDEQCIPMECLIELHFCVFYVSAVWSSLSKIQICVPFFFLLFSATHGDWLSSSKIAI